MTIQEMQDRKRELGYTNEMIAEKAGLPLGTVQKIFAGLTKAPRRSTIEALERLFAVKSVSYAERMEKLPAFSGIRESESAYSAQMPRGPYTIDDYYALPDYPRVELIDGYFYDMSSPSIVHQTILGQLFLQFAAWAEKHPECRVYFAPLDVRLDNDNYTMVQPDLLVICGKNDGDPRRINGAPDLVVEVLSPSSRLHDMYLKLTKYQKAGVREYWLVDPMIKKISVYDFGHDEHPLQYSFADRVPIRISGGECAVDFAKISAALKEF